MQNAKPLRHQVGHTIFDFDDTVYELSSSFVEIVYQQTDFFESHPTFSGKGIEEIIKLFHARKYFDLRDVRNKHALSNAVFDLAAASESLYRPTFISPKAFELVNKCRLIGRERLLFLTYTMFEQFEHKESILQSEFEASEWKNDFERQTEYWQIPYDRSTHKPLYSKSEFINSRNIQVGKLIDDSFTSLMDILTNVRSDLIRSLNAVVLVKRNWVTAEEIQILQDTIVQRATNPTNPSDSFERQVEFFTLDPY